MDQELKQRLIGASVIIALAVIFVPMLFDGEVEQKNNQNISINIPDVDENNLQVKKFELDKPVAQTSEMPPNEVELVVKDNQVQLIDKDVANQPSEPESKQSERNAVVESTEQASVAGVEQPTNEQKEKKSEPTPLVSETNPKVEAKPVLPPVKELSKPAVNNTSLNQVFRVKLGSFSQQSNAEKVKSSLLQKNIKAIVEYNPGLKLYRVWSQELYRDEKQANAYVKAVDQLKLNIGTPKVLTISAEEVALMASQGQMGWVVQLGSFSAKENAIELRNKANAAGFSGFVDVITNSKGVKLYRLRIGPLMEKMDAEQTLVEIKQKLKLDGLIKSHELGIIVD